MAMFREGWSRSQVLKAAGHEELLGGPFDGRVGEDRSRVLAPGSSAPLHEVGEDGFPGLQGG
eukprot:CAMPEP_0184416638 /NCGR_PEP_ID=MMETSP0738-20130409/9632_1 /TAXON_ID=385413 /ORGANISM="Thalassiosira miniscula, Strain CCMP1093" /LENGTH=61 /DNA_ID=CAMNT_0026776125 /DNA_START=533 /DNA_END=713 /DNA_ORIENTATION=-